MNVHPSSIFHNLFVTSEQALTAEGWLDPAWPTIGYSFTLSSAVLLTL